MPLNPADPLTILFIGRPASGCSAARLAPITTNPASNAVFKPWEVGMKKVFRLKMMVFTVVVVLSLCIGSVASAKEQVWRFALEEIEGTLQHALATKFKELMAEKSNGQIKVEVYPIGQLGTIDQMTELLQNGAIQFSMISPGHLGSFIPEVQVFSINYLFPDNTEVIRSVLKGNNETFRVLGPHFEKKQLKLIALFSEGYHQWTMKRPVRSPEDFAGLKMRVMTSPILVEAYKAYGANPTPLPFSEVYSSLQLNMIEGQENPYATIQEMKFYEVTDYMVTAKHRMYVISMSSNAAFFNGLPKETQDMVREAVSESLDYYYEFENDFNTKRLQQIMEAKPSYQHIILTPEEIAVFKEKSKGARDVYVDMVGPTGAEVLKAIDSDIRSAQ